MSEAPNVPLVVSLAPGDLERIGQILAANVVLALEARQVNRARRYPSVIERVARSLKGKKTIIFGLLLPIVPIVLDKLDQTDWTRLGLSPVAGAVIGAIVIALRAGTNTPIGKSEPQVPIRVETGR